MDQASYGSSHGSEVTVYGESVTLMDNLTSAATDGCLQPTVDQSCSSPSVNVVAGARTRLVLRPVGGCSSMGLADACMWAAHWFIDTP